VRRASLFVCAFALACGACSYEVDDYHVVVASDDARVDGGGGDTRSPIDAGDAVPTDGGDDGDVMCDPTLFSCAGFCVDLSSDSKNCGTCGHSCPSGQCKKGNCK
jgi:hypothetical protein